VVGGIGTGEEVGENSVFGSERLQLFTVPERDLAVRKLNRWGTWQSPEKYHLRRRKYHPEKGCVIESSESEVANSSRVKAKKWELPLRKSRIPRERTRRIRQWLFFELTAICFAF